MIHSNIIPQNITISMQLRCHLISIFINNCHHIRRNILASLSEANLSGKSVISYFFCLNFNNISVKSWWSVSLVEVREKTTDLPQVTDKLYHIMLYTITFYITIFNLQ